MGPNVSKVLFDHLEECRSVNFPQVSGPRTQERLRICLNTCEDIGVCQFLQSRRSMGPDVDTVFFPQVSGPRTQERRRFCLST